MFLRKFLHKRANKFLLLALFILPFSVWILISTSLLIFSDKLIFKNQNSKGSVKSSLKYEEFFLGYGKNQKLYIAQSFTKKDPITILFFHGNTGIPGRVFDSIASKYNIIAPAYPGYHLSDGNSNENSIYQTVDLSLKYLKDKGIRQEDIVVFGSSLGGVAAIYAGLKYPNLKRVIIVGAFDKIQSVCRDVYHIFCVFSGSILDNTKSANLLKAKIRQFHSIDDVVIKIEFGKNLFSSIASQDKKFHQINGKHGDFDAVQIIKTSLED